MEQKVDIKSMSITELKALKADIYELMEQQRINLQVLNGEIAGRKAEGKRPELVQEPSVV